MAAFPASPRAETYLSAVKEPPLQWDLALDELERGSTCWLATTSPDQRPHVVPVLSVVVDGAVHVASAPGTQKARNLARDARATITTHGQRLDVVVEGSAARVGDAGELAAVAAAYAARHGWEVQVHDGALQGEGAPTAGPGPYDVYRLEAVRAFGFPTTGDLTPTRWRFLDGPG